MSYFGLKTTRPGYILIQEQNTNNLILYDSNFVEKFKFPSEQKDLVPFEKFRQPHFSNEGNKVIWFGAKTRVFVLDLQDMSLLKLDKLMPDIMDTDSSI
jgi:hypothetical protein